jgi:FG-GAP-like repeat
MRNRLSTAAQSRSSNQSLKRRNRSSGQTAILCLIAFLVVLCSAPPLLAQTPIGSGDAVMGTITNGGQDTWTFTAAPGNSILLRAGKLSDNGNFGLNIGVYNPDGSPAAGGRNFTDAFTAFTATQSGTYSVVITSYIAGGAGTYELYFAKAPSTFVVPPGDDGGSLINAGSKIGTINLGDLDLWSFVAYSGQTVSLRCGKLTDDNGLFGINIGVYNPDGSPAAGGRNFTDASVVFTARQSGTYLVVINSYIAGGTGTYQLSYSRNADPAKADFNHDGLPDWVLENPATGQLAIWYLGLNGTSIVGGGFARSLPAGWALVDADHFGSSTTFTDLLLYNHTTQQTGFWFLNNSGLIGGAVGSTLPAGWTLLLSQDFNGDTNPDLLLENLATRQTAVWYLSPYRYGNIVSGGEFGPTLPAGWVVTGAADFNGDGRGDLLLWNSSTRQTAIWYLNGANATGALGPTTPPGWRPAGVDDFNRDGKPDLVIWNPSTHQTAIWHLNNNVLLSNSVYGPSVPAGWSLVAPK